MKKALVIFLLLQGYAMFALAQEFLVVEDEVIPVSEIDSMTYGVADDFLDDMIKRDPSVTLFAEALKATGIDRVLRKSFDESYTVGRDSIDWTNDKLVTYVAAGYDNVAYMPCRFFKFTAFVEKDEVFHEHGIYCLKDLEKKAAELYGPMYPEDADVTDLTDSRNYLNRFVAYHILDRYAPYYSLTAVDGENSTLASLFNREVLDIADWYETLMPHSIMKCSFPSGTDEGLYVNRRGVQNRADERGVFIRGAKVASPGEAVVATEAANGIYHYIDDIIAYDQQTQKVVLDERMRIDCTTLSPDFMTSGARGHYTRSFVENGKYGAHDYTASHDNWRTCLGFKTGAAKNFEFTSATHIHVRPRTLGFWSYQGDEVTVKGQFDFTVKLPPVPEGDYELRLMTCLGDYSRGMIQFYLDGQSCGIPVDFRLNGTAPTIGWESDASFGEDEEAMAAFDEVFHSRGWMKGPKSYYCGTGNVDCMRDRASTLRKVLTKFHTDGNSDHYLRVVQVLDSPWTELDFDFIELCPSTVYNNAYIPEDRW